MGDLDFDTLLLVTVAGTAVLALARRPLGVVPLAVRALTVVGFTVVAAGRSAADADDARRAVVVAVAALVVGEVVVRLVDRARRGPLLGVVLGSAAVAAAGYIDDVERAAAVAVAGAGLVVLVAIATRATGVVVVPGVLLLAVDTLATYDHHRLDVPFDRVGVGAAVVGVLAALVGRPDPGEVDDDTAIGAFGGPRLAVAAFAVALVLLAQDLPDWRAAGLLVAGGATLATASRHRVGLVALLPGVAATLAAAGGADHPVHAAAGAAIILVVLTTSTTTGPRRPDGTLTIDVRTHWATALALVFAAVPLWGWSNADVGPGYPTAVGVAGAVVAVAVVAAGAGRLATRADDWSGTGV